MNSGAFISFEGSEGAGKSTMIETVYDFIYNNVTSKVIKIRDEYSKEGIKLLRKYLRSSVNGSNNTISSFWKFVYLETSSFFTRE